MMSTSCHVRLVSLLVFLAFIQGIHGIEFTVTNRAEGTDGGRVFNEKIGTDHARKMLSLATFNMEFWVLQIKHPSERKEVESISLFIDEMDAISTHHVQEKHHQIHVSAKHIENCSPSRLLVDFNVVMYYETAHVWQWTANGQAPISLRDGIANYAAFFVLGRPKSGSNVEKRDGWSWNKNPEVISEFLFFCAEMKSDFVATLNKKMKVTYRDQYFAELLQHPIEELWEMYKVKYGGKE